MLQTETFLNLLMSCTLRSGKLNIFFVDEEQVVRGWIERGLDSFAEDFDEDDFINGEPKKKPFRASKVNLRKTLWMRLYHSLLTSDVNTRGETIQPTI